LCPVGNEACGSYPNFACFLPSQYTCVNGQLQQGGGGGAAAGSAAGSGAGSVSGSTVGSTTGVSGGTPVKLYGVDYNPRRPDDTCPTLAQVEVDVQALVQISNRVRLYSVDDCTGGQLVLQAIQNTGVDLTVYLGIWLDTYFYAEFPDEYTAFINLIEAVGLDDVEAIIVGSETQYRGDFSAATLEGFLQNISATVASYGYSNIYVSTADVIYNLEGSSVLGYEPIVWANQFPFWEGKSVTEGFTLIQNTIAALRQSTGSKPIIIGETGWPTDGLSYEDAVPGLANAQEYLNLLVCWFHANDIGYFWFEAFDEPYKPDTSGLNLDVEPYFGVYTQDRVPKAGITLPIYC